MSLEEKPCRPKSNLAVIGLYFYNNSIIDVVKNIKPYPRGEIEITEINNLYLSNSNLNLVNFVEVFYGLILETKRIYWVLLILFNQ